MQYRTLDAVRLLKRPRLVAVLARKHNTRAGSSEIGTKENPFAAVNFGRELAADNLDGHSSKENWRAVRHRPAGERERRPPVSLLCFDTQLFARARARRPPASPPASAARAGRTCSANGTGLRAGTRTRLRT